MEKEIERQEQGENVPVHGEFHLRPIIRDWLVHIAQLHANLGAEIPAQRRADHTATKVIFPVHWVAQHQSKVFRDVAEQDMQRFIVGNHRVLLENAIVEYPSSFAFRERKELRIPCTVELQRHLHRFLSGQLGTGKADEDRVRVLLVQLQTVFQRGRVVLLEFEPPVRLEFLERCMGVTSASLTSQVPLQGSCAQLTHRLMVGPAKRSIRPMFGLLEHEPLVLGRQRDVAECSIIGEITQLPNLAHRDLRREHLGTITFAPVIIPSAERAAEQERLDGRGRHLREDSL